MRINNNLMAMNTHRQLGINNTGTSKSLEKLSSGFKINRAGDDAAGLAISEKMRGQIRGLNMASKNAQDGISLIQTAEGALNETHAILQRMRELAVQSATDTNTDDDRIEIQKEVDQLASEISRIAEQTEFNTQKLLDGTYSDKKFHIGANKDQNTTIAISDMASKALEVGNNYTSSGADLIKDGTKVSDAKFIKAGTTLFGSEASGNLIEAKVDGYYIGSGTSGAKLEVISSNLSGTDTTIVGGIKVFTQSDADSAITTINNAISTVSAERSKLGAMQNRLEHTIKNLDTSAENLQAAESRIRDVDMAKEMMEFTKQNILQQAATAMLAQANQMPSTVLQLLR